jgi:hypothetical protein
LTRVHDIRMNAGSKFSILTRHLLRIVTCSSASLPRTDVQARHRDPSCENVQQCLTNVLQSASDEDAGGASIPFAPSSRNKAEPTTTMRRETGPPRSRDRANASFYHRVKRADRPSSRLQTSKPSKVTAFQSHLVRPTRNEASLRVGGGSNIRRLILIIGRLAIAVGIVFYLILRLLVATPRLAAEVHPLTRPSNRPTGQATPQPRRDLTPGSTWVYDGDVAR